jgi:hypothetical protein
MQAPKYDALQMAHFAAPAGDVDYRRRVDMSRLAVALEGIRTFQQGLDNSIQLAVTHGPSANSPIP